MFADRSRWADYLTFTALLVAGLIAFGRVALPFMVSPGPLALNNVENTPEFRRQGCRRDPDAPESPAPDSI